MRICLELQELIKIELLNTAILQKVLPVTDM